MSLRDSKNGGTSWSFLSVYPNDSEFYNGDNKKREQKIRMQIFFSPPESFISVKKKTQQLLESWRWNDHAKAPLIGTIQSC